MKNIQMYHNNIPWQQQAEGLLDEVDSELGKQLEDVQVNWDTERKKILDYEKYPGTLY